MSSGNGAWSEATRGDDAVPVDWLSDLLQADGEPMLLDDAS